MKRLGVFRLMYFSLGRGAIYKVGVSAFLQRQGPAMMYVYHHEGYLMPGDRLKVGYFYLSGHSQTRLPGPLSLLCLQAGQQRVL